MPANQSGAESIADRTHVITRQFDVPARFLFEAYSKSEHLMKWFGPKGWPLTLCEVDFRVGGRYRFAMTGPSGERNTPFGGKYLEIVPNRKIVFDNAFEDPASKTMIMTVALEEKAGRTTLVLSTLFEDVAMMKEYLGMGFDEGSNSAYDLLIDVVADLKRKAG